MKPLVLRDEVHGDIQLDGLLRQVVDHPSFQRLRYIKSVGLAEYTFPSATHTRFQHSLGASYLADQAYRYLFQNWHRRPFALEGKEGDTVFYASRTSDCLAVVKEDSDSYRFWLDVVTLAAMLHDVGHGPWSHTFEELGLPQDFSKAVSPIEGSVGSYLTGIQEEKKRFSHEDISVLYVHRIFSELGPGVLSRYFLPVVGLIHKKLALESDYESELQTHLQSAGIQGGTDMHHLLKPMISGPFDVDRMDYIQRDARNCGVHIGGIEWRRMVKKLTPVLAHHPNSRNEPTNVVLVTELKNQHVLDDFVFSLFQMYAQVYMHPKTVGLEYCIRLVLEKESDKFRRFSVDLDTHQSMSDDSFRRWLVQDMGLGEVDRLLHRESGAKFKVASFPSSSVPSQKLVQLGYEQVEVKDRPMLKDGVGVYLFHQFTEEPRTYFTRSWSEASPIAQEFHNLYHSPSIWIRRGLA